MKMVGYVRWGGIFSLRFRILLCISGLDRIPSLFYAYFKGVKPNKASCSFSLNRDIDTGKAPLLQSSAYICIQR